MFDGRACLSFTSDLDLGGRCAQIYCGRGISVLVRRAIEFVGSNVSLAFKKRREPDR
ncbi:unnamed protein product [Linum tenue]|uniref:Uncharacterized protein n=1 Tax=Linum tenue TaxID=586396 RepID=A0AAV0MF15_9ROSI|nr:unnamed protein product [Linum tenue]